MNSKDLEIWSKTWGANNNVNNYEIESLPFPVPEDDLAFSIYTNDTSTKTEIDFRSEE